MHGKSRGSGGASRSVARLAVGIVWVAISGTVAAQTIGGHSISDLPDIKWASSQGSPALPRRPVAVLSTCDALARAVDSEAKELSYIMVDGMGEDSAVRASNNQLQKLVVTNLMQMNLTLMQGNKCTLPRAPISEPAYMMSALACHTEVMKGRLKGAHETPAECDRDKWKRMDER